MTDTAPLTADQIRAFVLAGHGDLDQVKLLLAEQPSLLNVAYEWQPNDTETALQGAAHVGNAAIAEFLLEAGAPLDICTAAMLGRHAEVVRFVEADPTQAQATGAHQIPLLAHAAFSGNVELVRLLVERGAINGMAAALFNAANKGHTDLALWLLEHGQPDLAWKSYQGKTSLSIAKERGLTNLVAALEARGATE